MDEAEPMMISAPPEDLGHPSVPPWGFGGPDVQHEGFRLEPPAALGGRGALRAEDEEPWVPLLTVQHDQRLSYEVKGIATLYDWLLPSGHCFQPDAGPDLSQLQGLSVQCLGVWGSLEDIMGFLRAKLRTRQTVLRKLEEVPPGLYCCHAPPDKGGPLGATTRVVMFVVPLGGGFGNGESSASSLCPASPASLNCLLLRFLYECCSQRVCLFGAASLRRFQPQAFPFTPEPADTLLPLFDMGLASAQTAHQAADDRVLRLLEGPSVGLPKRRGEARPGWAVVSSGGGGLPSCMVLHGAAGEQGEEEEEVEEEVEAAMSATDFQAWAITLPRDYAGRVRLRLQHTREVAALLRAALPSEWSASGLSGVLQVVQEVRDKQRRLRSPEHVRLRASEARKRYNRLIDALLQRDWHLHLGPAASRHVSVASHAAAGESRPFGALPRGGDTVPMAEALDVQVEWDGLRELVGQVDADPRVAIVLEHLSEASVRQAAMEARAREATARAAQEVLHGLTHATLTFDHVCRRLEELGGSLEAYVAEANKARPAMGGLGLLSSLPSLSSLSSLWGGPSAMTRIRERAAQLEASEPLDRHVHNSLLQARAALRVVGAGREWDGPIAAQLQLALDALTLQEKKAMARRDQLLQELGERLTSIERREEEEEEAGRREGEGRRKMIILGVEEVKAMVHYFRVRYQTTAPVAQPVHSLSAYSLLPRRAELQRLAHSQRGERKLCPLSPVLVPRAVLRLSDPRRTLLLFAPVSDKHALAVSRVPITPSTTSTSSSSTGGEMGPLASHRVEVQLVALAKGEREAVRLTPAPVPTHDLDDLAPLHIFYRDVGCLSLDVPSRLLAVCATQEGPSSSSVAPPSTSVEVMIYRFDEHFRALSRHARLLLDTSPAPLPSDHAPCPPRLLQSLHLVPSLDKVMLVWGDGSLTSADYPCPTGTARETILLPAPSPASPRRLVVMPRSATMQGPTVLLLCPRRRGDTQGDEDTHGYPASSLPAADSATAALALEAEGEGEEGGDMVTVCGYAITPSGLVPLPGSATVKCPGLWEGEGGRLAHVAVGGYQDQLVCLQGPRLHCTVVADREDMQWPQGAGGREGLGEAAGIGSTVQQGPGCSNGRLDVLFHAFDKFPVHGPGGQGGSVEVLVEGEGEEVGEYLRKVLDAVRQQCQKDVLAGTQLRLRTRHWAAMSELGGGEDVGAEGWMSTLLCLLPLQIARVEGGRLCALRDGQSIPAPPTAAQGTQALQTVGELSRMVRFGVLEWVLRQGRQWPLVVISAIGAQSTGKSYLLNHVGGAFFDVAGGRCTDGVWMSVRVREDGEGGRVMEVLLDFEGLGSFERTEHEDMLLGVLASALSDVTLLRSHFQLDRYTQQTLTRLSLGARSCGLSGRGLFQGKLWVCLKDVVANDRDAVCTEFRTKLDMAVEEEGGVGNPESWRAQLFQNQVQLLALPPFGHPRFHPDLMGLRTHLCRSLPTNPPRYATAGEFVSLVKLLLAKLDFADWTALEADQAQARARAVKERLHTAVYTGLQRWGVAQVGLEEMDSGLALEEEGQLHVTLLLSAKERREMEQQIDSLTVLDASEGMEDVARCVVVLRHLGDAGLVLGPMEGGEEDEAIHQRLLQLLSALYPHGTENAYRWGANVRALVGALVDRRVARVRQWAQTNLRHAGTQGQEAQEQVESALLDLRRRRALCGQVLGPDGSTGEGEALASTCAQCFVPCNQRAGHAGAHDCGFAHTCDAACSFCPPATEAHEHRGCSERKGHSGPHSCGDHACGQACSLAGQARGCVGSCARQRGHSGDCLCPADDQHFCNGHCPLPHCPSLCTLPVATPHAAHVCGNVDQGCMARCSLCANRCASRDHYHGLAEPIRHLCAHSHQCMRECEAQGVCRLRAERERVVSKKHKGRKGQRGAEVGDTIYREERLRCVKMIPAGQERHDGPCVCVSATHQCPARCPLCAYYCALPIHHAGKHNCKHGKVKLAKLLRPMDTQARQAPAFDVDSDQASVLGLGSVSCGSYCRRLGRGHVHLMDPPPLPHTHSHSHLSDSTHTHTGAETALLLGSEGGEKGAARQVTHGSYCEHMGWEDWSRPLVSEAESRNMDKCNAVCGHAAHPLSGGEALPSKAYCVLPRWHAPVGEDWGLPPGYDHRGLRVTADGHVLDCPHGPALPPLQHAIFLVPDPSDAQTMTVQRQRQEKAAILPCLLPWLAAQDMLVSRLGLALQAVYVYLLKRRSISKADRMSLLLYDGGNARSVLRVLNDEPISAATFREAVVRLCGAEGKLLAWRLRRLEQAQSMIGGLASALGRAHKCLKELREASALQCFMCRKGEGQEGEVHGRRVMVEPCGHVLCDDHAGPIAPTTGPTAKGRDTCPACAQRVTRVAPLPSAEEEEEEDSEGEGRGGDEGREERRPAFRLQHKPILLLFAAIKTETEQAQKAERKLERVLSEEEDEERLGGCVCWDSSVQCGADAHRIQVHAYNVALPGMLSLSVSPRASPLATVAHAGNGELHDDMDELPGLEALQHGDTIPGPTLAVLAQASMRSVAGPAVGAAATSSRKRQRARKERSLSEGDLAPAHSGRRGEGEEGERPQEQLVQESEEEEEEEDENEDPGSDRGAEEVKRGEGRGRGAAGVLEEVGGGSVHSPNTRLKSTHLTPKKRSKASTGQAMHSPPPRMQPLSDPSTPS